MRLPGHRLTSLPLSGCSAIPPRAFCLRLSTPTRTPVGGLELWLWQFHATRCRGGVSGSLQFPGNPGGPMPCSRTPAATLDPWSVGRGSWPPGRENRRLTAGEAISGLNSTAWVLAVYASQGLLPGPTQDSLPVADQALPGGIAYPQGSCKRFPDGIRYIFPPFPGFAGRYPCPPPARVFGKPPQRFWPAHNL
jgi:hypothetical protein